MAKSKKSRRVRRQETVKPKQNGGSAATVQSAGRVQAPTPAPVKPAPTPAVPRKVVNFVEEYHYVYTELRNVSLVAVAMFIIMVGLSYFI